MFAKFFYIARHVIGLVAPKSIKRLLMVVALLGICSAAANAYTLVLRSGRRVDIPAKFILSERTLTYEAAPGMNVTLLLAAVDIPATERANNEPQGSFLKHAAPETVAAAQPAPPAAPARTTITNRELEPARNARLYSEQAYEKRRRELGLPSINESRRRQAEQEDEMLTMVRRRAGDEANTREYWQTRARTLRSEIAAVDAQIGYVRSRLSDLGQPPPVFTSVYQLPPWWNPSGYPGRPRNGCPIPGIGYPYPYGYPRGRGSIYGTDGPFDYRDDSYARERLQERLDDLGVQRAGLAAQWLQLENEARDARVPQVWLEP